MTHHAPLDALLTRPDWQRDALCKEHPEVDFFPAKGQSAAPAKAVCARCLVRDECHEYASSLPDALYGVWAGVAHNGTSVTKRRASRAA